MGAPSRDVGSFGAWLHPCLSLVSVSVLVCRNEMWLTKVVDIDGNERDKRRHQQSGVVAASSVCGGTLMSSNRLQQAQSALDKPPTRTYEPSVAGGLLLLLGADRRGASRWLFSEDGLRDADLVAAATLPLDRPLPQHLVSLFSKGDPWPSREAHTQSTHNMRAHACTRMLACAPVHTSTHVRRLHAYMHTYMTR